MARSPTRYVYIRDREEAVIEGQMVMAVLLAYRIFFLRIA